MLAFVLGGAALLACDAVAPHSGFDPAAVGHPGDASGALLPEGGPTEFVMDGGTYTAESAPPGLPLCGNASREAKEACDDGNALANDGCSASCEIEPGYTCPKDGAACVATACGDGIVAGEEDCDDGNAKSADGCSNTCVLESGFKCPTPAKACAATSCGDGAKEGTEQCDDHNLRPYDGCSPACTLEPVCANGTCVALCGDGVKFPGEPCDDGNVRSGDGCSATCQLETGFACEVVSAALPQSVDIPVIYRDFKDSHPDFEHWCCGAVRGMVQGGLDPQKKPLLANVGNPQMITSAGSFSQWYSDIAGINSVVLDKLTLRKQPDDSFLFDTTAFFPVDSLGFGNQGRNHNFHFTSELRYWFTYKGGEVLDFRGDDDVFVFINGRLAVDIGGVHEAAQGTVTLDATTATQLGLVVGGMYEFVVFQAERHTRFSNYRLTLRGFVQGKTSCKSVCGDGIKTKDEACDDGHNAGGYGMCGPGCALGPRCGDGVVQSGELCDDGNLIGSDGCSSTCVPDTPLPTSPN